MVGQKLFKTRLCILYRKGQCYRQTCSFAHGDAELRRYNPSSSFNGRRDYHNHNHNHNHNADLREKLGRQRSPPRDYSSPRSLKKSDWGQRKRQHFDNESDYSGSLRLSDGGERQNRERKHSSSEFDDVHDEQLEQVQSEFDMLEDHRHQLQMYLEEGIQEADSLNSKIEELEMQLSREKEECRRISSKMKKFVKANIRHARIQDELKRSEDRIERLGDELGSDAGGGGNEEDMSINILSDEGMSPKNGKVSPRKDDNYHFMGPQSPSKKRMRFQMLETDEKTKQAGKRLNLGNMGGERYSRYGGKMSNGMRNSRAFVDDKKPMQRNNNSPANKVKSRRMVASMMDEEVDAKEMNSNSPKLVLPPPPPLPSLAQDAYLQKNKGKDEANEELVDVDIV